MSIAKKSMIALVAALMTTGLSAPSFSQPDTVTKPVRTDTGFCLVIPGWTFCHDQL
jgi:hypothetical protein